MDLIHLTVTVLSLGRSQAGPDLELVALFPVFCHSLVPPLQSPPPASLLASLVVGSLPWGVPVDC